LEYAAVTTRLGRHSLDYEAPQEINGIEPRDLAMRQGWGGRPVRVEQAQGILVAALGVLAAYYGYCLSGR
jgi:hypothetical protein